MIFYRPENFGGVSGGVSGGVNSIYGLIKDNPGLRLPQIANLIRKPEKTVEKWLEKLKDKKMIEFRGSPKIGGYFVK